MWSLLPILPATVFANALSEAGAKLLQEIPLQTGTISGIVWKQKQ